MDQMEKRLGADKPGSKSSIAASCVHCPRWIIKLDKATYLVKTTTFVKIRANHDKKLV